MRKLLKNIAPNHKTAMILLAAAILLAIPSCDMDLSNGYKRAYRDMAKHEKSSLKAFKKNTQQPKTKAQNKADKAIEKSEKEAAKQRKKELKMHHKKQSAMTRKMMRMTKKQARKYNRDLERKKR